MTADDSEDALIARLRSAQKQPVEKIPEPLHDKDDDPWDVVFVETGSLTLTILAAPMRAIRWIRERRRKAPKDGSG